MFHFSGRLDHLLEPRDYLDAGVFAEEMTSIFSREWNLFCLASDLASENARFAGTVAGKPVVVINQSGRLKAFSNVCGHRHSVICPAGAGTGERLKCQIHGWEYDCDGHLARIPDGKHFKVVKPGDFSLTEYRVEKCGPFVFVNLSPEGVSFEETLGKLAEEFHYWYDDVRLVDVWTHEHEVNWKIPVENAVESYHVPMVHPNTYEDYRDEALHDHQLEPGYSRYADLLPYEDKPGLISLGFRVYTKLFIKNPTFSRFTHTHLYPNMMLYYGDVYRNLSVLQPISPKRFRFTCYSFVPKAFRFGWIGRRIQDLSMLVFMRMGRRIVGEDVRLWPAVQTGLESSSHRGVLSAREERVFAFQQYVSRMLGRGDQR
jgi:phenylpropionate dioxygenase-like ring-hydroxylating dioxygenase large terminal subunit